MSLQVDFNILNAGNSPSIKAGLAADRPVIAANGALYITTDTLLLQRFNGSTWDDIGGGGGGSITGSGTADTIPIFTGTSQIGDSTIVYTPPAIGTAASYGTTNNTNLVLPFTSSAPQPIGLYIYEAPATGFNIQRVVAAPNYNSIYSGNSDIQFKLFDGATDFYHRFYKTGNISINSETDNGNRFQITGSANITVRLGIGTTTPGAPLDIHTTGVGAQINGTTTNDAFLLFQNAGSSKWRIGNNYSGATNYFSIYDSTNAVEPFRLTQGTLGNAALTLRGTITQSNATAGMRFDNGSQQYWIGYSGADFAIQQFLVGTYMLIKASNGRILMNTTTDNGNQVQINGSLSVSSISMNSGGISTVNNGTVDIGGAAVAFRTIFVNTINSGTSVNFLTIGVGTFGMNVRKSANTEGVIYVQDSSTVSTSNATILSLESTTRGFRPPRMTTAQKNAIASPVAGLVIYDTDLNKLCVYTTAWQTITSA